MSRCVLYEDPSLPHQIVVYIKNPGALIAVSCNCMRTSRNGRKALAAKVRWDDPNDILKIYAWHISQV